MARPTRRPLASAKAGRTLHPLGSAPGYRWLVNADHVDMSQPPPAPRVLTIEAAPQTVAVDLGRTAMIVVDMQNDFCAKGGWADHLGVDVTPDRSPIEPLRRLLPALRAAGLQGIWLNCGNRPDPLNMAPKQLHLYKPTRQGMAAGVRLPGTDARLLQQASAA